MSLLPALLAAASAWLSVPPAVRIPRPAPVVEPTRATVRWWLAAAAGIAGSFLLGGGPVVAVLLGLACWRLLTTVAGAAVRRRSAEARGDLVALVGLVALALRAGLAAPEAVSAAAAALPGAAADRLSGPLAQLSWGADPGEAWSAVAQDDALGPLGRTLERAQRTGAPVADAVQHLADELAESSRLQVEERARQVGVKAALPLGICFLPAFLALGIVPLVAGLVGALGWRT